MPPSLREFITLRAVSDNVFETLHHPERMGNTANIAYGGFTLSAAVAAAHVDIPSNFHMYTAMGSYLGPALTDRNLCCVVRLVRKTRTFITKQIEVRNTQDDGGHRACLTVLVDFQVAEPATMLNFSKPPKGSYTKVEQTRTLEDMIERLGTAGAFTEEEYCTAFAPFLRFFDRRDPPESTSAENQIPFKKTRPSSQDHLSVVDKTTAFYFKARESLQSKADHAAALTWLQDVALSFTPLVHSGLTLHDASACSSLDFALRVFVNDLDMNEWHLRESRCITAGAGRTYSEAQIWDKSGRMVSSMTQQSILRPWPEKSAKI